MRDKSTASVIILVATCLFAWSAGASPLYSGTVHGAFSDPVLAGYYLNVAREPVFIDNSTTAIWSIVNGPTSAVVSSGNTDPTITPPDQPSRVTFNGASFANVAPNEEFDLGTIAFFNGSSLTRSVLFGATLTLSVLDNPQIAPAVSQMELVGTSRNPSPILDADFLHFSPLSLTFNVFEGATATATMRGMIIGDPQLSFVTLQLDPDQGLNGFLASIPEPSSLLLLFGGLALAIPALRRKGV